MQYPVVLMELTLVFCDGHGHIFEQTLKVNEENKING